MEMASVLQAVCQRVLQDPSVPKLVARARAEALRLLGRTFRTVAREAGKAPALAQLLDQAAAAANAAAAAGTAAQGAPPPNPRAPAPSS